MRHSKFYFLDHNNEVPEYAGNQAIDILGAINTTRTESKERVQVTIQFLYDDFSKTLICLMVPTIKDLAPSETFSRDSFKLPQNIRLAGIS